MNVHWFRIGVVGWWVWHATSGLSAAPVLDNDMAATRANFHQRYAQLLDHDMIRPFNEPAILDHGHRTKQVVVLVHGYTDSPYFMHDVGKFFYDQGFNVVIPLLPGHGLQNPQPIKTVTFQQWLDEGQFAVEIAAHLGDIISIGGLSTGGTISVYLARQNPQKINGGIFLFSAALGLGRWGEMLLRSPLAVSVCTWGHDAYLKYIIGVPDAVEGIGDSPFRYSKVFYEGGHQLVLMIDKLRSFYPDEANRYRDLQQPLFVVHSEADATADIHEIDRLVSHYRDPNKLMFMRIKADLRVEHSNVPLAEDLVTLKNNRRLLLQEKNPLFPQMVEQIRKFVQIHLL